VISFNVTLRLRNEGQARSLAQAVSNPRSTSYGHYLTARQFNRRFAPTGAQVAQVSSFLGGQGLQVTGVAQGNRWVSARGTAAQVERAFATTLQEYQFHGRVRRAASQPLSVPSQLRPLILGVVGVTQTPTVRKPFDAVPPPSSCSTYWNQYQQVAPPAYGRASFPTYNCGYTAKQVRTAYGMQSAVHAGKTGSGVTVAIIDAYASPTMRADADGLSASQGEPTFRPGQYTQHVFRPFNMRPACGGMAGWNTEQSLDVEAVHALAPGAKIRYIGAQNCDTGIDQAMNYVIQNHVADLVSNSYGFAGEDGLGDEVSIENSMFMQAAIEGIGLYFSSGDNGDNAALGATPHPEPDFPASSPWVTAVGGTSLAVRSSGAYQFETSWGSNYDPVDFTTSPSSYAAPLPGYFLFGGGGGVSALFGQPGYQQAAVPNALARLNGGAPMRVVPDVATVGDPYTGFMIRYAGVDSAIGGTSLSCPVFAGIQALASQGRDHAIGFANPSLYQIGMTPGVFRDVKAPRHTVAIATPSGKNLITFGQDSSLTSTRGYDDTTGLGTPHGSAYLAAAKALN